MIISASHPLFPARTHRAALLSGCICWFFLGGLLPAAQAQTATVRGFVTSASDGQPMPLVNVTLRSTAGTVYGAATDNDGFYAVSRVPAGRYLLTATFLGFIAHADTLDLVAGQILNCSIALREQATELGEVVVETDQETEGAANVTAGLQTVRPADIELIPAPDISADLVNYLTVLPGIISQGDRGGQLFIRGGEPTQNLVLLDGMLVYQPFHVVGFFSAFPSEIIQSADVYAGGYGGRYGGRLSSVIDVLARTGNKQRFSGAVSAAPFVSAVRLEGPLVPGKVSVMASVRESVIAQGAERLIDTALPFRFGDRFGKLHATLTDGLQFSLSGLQTHDEGRLGLDPLGDNLPQDKVTWQNEAVGARLLFLPASLPVFAEFLASYSALENTFGPEALAVRATTVERYSFAANLSHYLGNTDFHWGLFLNSSALSSDLGGRFQNVAVRDEFVTEAGFYVEPEISLKGARIQPGLRLQTFPSQGRTFLEPRLRVVWNTGVHRFSMAGGFYHQQVVGLNDRRDAGDIFTAWTAAPLGVVPEALHLIAGWNVKPLPGLQCSLEGFYKQLSDLLVPEWTAFPRFTTNLQSASGMVLGTDVRVEAEAGPLSLVTSYGYAQVEYESPIEALRLEFGDERTVFSPPHDRRHQVNVVGGLRLGAFDLSVRWQFGSGLPYNQSIGFDEFILLDSLVNVLEEPGVSRVLYRRPYTGRLPAYHRLDVSLDRAFRLTPLITATAQAGVLNAYDRRNLFYLDLFTLRRIDQLPLLPTFGLKLEFQ